MFNVHLNLICQVCILKENNNFYSYYQDRYWAKNRQKILPPQICINGSEAIGVNVERNWHVHQSEISIIIITLKYYNKNDLNNFLASQSVFSIKIIISNSSSITSCHIELHFLYI